jgi:hypothetical protein
MLRITIEFDGRTVTTTTAAVTGESGITSAAMPSPSTAPPDLLTRAAAMGAMDAGPAPTGLADGLTGLSAVAGPMAAIDAGAAEASEAKEGAVPANHRRRGR